MLKSLIIGRPRLAPGSHGFKGDRQMKRLANVESDSLLKHGVVMIVLGTAVCALGSLMAKPIHEELGYVVAGTAIGAYLLIALLSSGLRASRRIATAYIAVGSVMVCYRGTFGHSIEPAGGGGPACGSAQPVLGLLVPDDRVHVPANISASSRPVRAGGREFLFRRDTRYTN